MKALHRRLERLSPVIARLHPPPSPPDDESLLSPEEWEDIAQINTITKEGGLAALSDADLDLMECFAEKLAGRRSGHALLLAESSPIPERTRIHW